jgi:hypothetical protein
MRGSEPASQDAAASRIRGQQADQEDRRLSDRVKAGDHEAFDVLFQRYFATVPRQAIRLTGDREEASFEEHLRRCDDCAAFLRTYKQTVQEVQSLKYEDIPQEMRIRVRQFLRSKMKKMPPSR